MHKMSSTSIFPSFNNNQSIPLSQQQTPNQDQCSTIRRRLSSVSLKSMSEYSSPATTWVLRSKSVSAFGEDAGNSIAKWWESGWDWILFKKPTFSVDLEMSEEEKEALGGQNKGSWRHVLYKLSSEIKKMVGGVEKHESVSNYFKNLDSRNYTLPH